MQKLTLGMEPEVIAMAKKQAKERGISVSKMVSDMIRVRAAPMRPFEITPRVKAATGLVKLPEGKTLEELIEEAKAERAERHLR
jgi:hypothetical protein